MGDSGTGTVAYVGQTVTFTPDRHLAANTTYTARIYLVPGTSLAMRWQLTKYGALQPLKCGRWVHSR